MIFKITGYILVRHVSNCIRYLQFITECNDVLVVYGTYMIDGGDVFWVMNCVTYSAIVFLKVKVKLTL